MDLFSVLYDPSTSSPFGVEIEHSDGTKSLYGLSTAGRSWANTGAAPEMVIRTGFAPYTKSAQEAMEPAMDGSVVLSLAEIREHTSPELVYVGRTVKSRSPEAPRSSFSMSNSVGHAKSRIIDYLASKFSMSLTRSSAVNEVKSANVGFSSKLNTLKTTSEDPSKMWLVDRVGSILGRGQMRRIGTKINPDKSSIYSENNRINRRVKSLIGNEEVDLSDYPVNERINISSLERFKRA
jgi:hypothetical protein